MATEETIITQSKCLRGSFYHHSIYWWWSSNWSANNSARRAVYVPERLVSCWKNIPRKPCLFVCVKSHQRLESVRIAHNGSTLTHHYASWGLPFALCWPEVPTSLSPILCITRASCIGLVLSMVPCVGKQCYQNISRHQNTSSDLPTIV